jgi:hypothetical protein
VIYVALQQSYILNVAIMIYLDFTFLPSWSMMGFSSLMLFTPSSKNPIQGFHRVGQFILAGALESQLTLPIQPRTTSSLNVQKARSKS